MPEAQKGYYGGQYYINAFSINDVIIAGMTSYSNETVVINNNMQDMILMSK